MLNLKPIRVLCMEDDAGLARLLQKKLERYGYKVDIAHDGEEGLTMYDSGSYDVVLTDSSMPELNGIEVVRVLASRGELPPLVMVTGTGNETIAVEALKLGVADYLLKDINGGYLELLPAVIEGTLEKKRLRKEKLKMEEEMRRQNFALKSAGQAIIMTDKMGAIIYVNPAFTKLTGYSAMEAKGQNPRILKTDRHPNDFYKKMWDTILNGNIWAGELTNKRKDNSLYEAHLTISPVFDNNNELESFVAVQSNITNKIKMEEELKKLSSAVDQTADHIIITDKRGNIEYTNPAFETATGYKKDEIIGKNPKILKSGNHDDSFYKNLWDTIKSGNVFRSEFINKKKNGELFYEEKTITPIKVKLKNREHCHFVSTGRDITERKQSEQQLNKSLKEKELLLRELHHRVKNNMQIIHSLLNLQLKFTKDQNTKDILKESQNRIKSMSFVHEILYKANDLTKIDLKEYIKNIGNSLFRSYGINSNLISLLINIDNVSLSMDTIIPLGLIITELVSNSLKYAFTNMQHGQIEIILTHGTNNEINMIVKDNGIGFPNDLDYKNSKTLGLQLVTGLIENQIKGSLEINNKNGTELIIRFKDEI